MNTKELKNIAENLNGAIENAGELSIKIYKQGLKVKIKEDGSPVTNGDIEVNKIITDKVKILTPNIPIVSEETVDLNKKKYFKNFLADRPY